MSSSWNQETKTKLNEKVTSNVNDLGSLVRHVIRASKSNDVYKEMLCLFVCDEAHCITECQMSFDPPRGKKRKVELLTQAAKNFVSQESFIQNSSETLKKMNLIRTHFEFQQSAIDRSMSCIDEIQDQLKTIQR